MAESTAGSEVLEELFAVIEARRGGDPDESYTARLFERGTGKIAGKLGEEAIEAIVEAMRGDRGRLVSESADLLYHLLVLWADQGVSPGEVWTELAGRQGVSGIEEKASRPKSRKSGQ